MNRILPLCLAMLILAGCAQQGDIFAENGITPFVPPQGDPTKTNNWRHYGPGVVMRTKAYAAEYDAANVLGSEQFSKVVSDANSPTERIPFKAFSGARTFGWAIDGSGGWRVTHATEIKAKLNLTNASTVDVRFGDTWIAPLTEQELAQASGIKDISTDTRKNLRQGKSFVILKSVYSDSIKIYFKRQQTNGGEVALKIPVVDAQTLGGSYRVDADGGVEVKEPVFVGYVPLSKEGVDQLLGDR